MSEKNNKSENKIIKGEDISEIKKENNNNINLDFYNDIIENQIQKRSFLTNIPSLYNNNNMYNNNIKNINCVEKNLNDKLNEIKEQIKILNKNNIEYNSENKYDENNIKIQLMKFNKIRLKEIENKYKNKQKEILINLEKNYEIKKDNKIFEDIKNNKKIKDNNNIILYQQMEQKFLEKENKLIHDTTNERKIKNLFYKQNINLESEKIDIINYKKNLEKRAEEQTKNMKKLWHSRSMLLKQYQNIKNNKTVVQNEINIEISKNNEDKKIDRKEYSKKNVKLPIINEKLKEESNWRKIDIKSLKGKERINYVNKKYFHKNNLLLNSLKSLNFGKKFFLGKKKKHSNNIKEKKFDNNYSSSDRKNVQPINIIIPRNKTVDYNNIKKEKINYLKEFRNKNKKEFHKWNKYIKKDKEELDKDGIYIINKKVEKLDEKVKMKKELMNVNGGYENNTELGNKVNLILVDSIKGKLTVLNELFYDDNNKK